MSNKPIRKWRERRILARHPIADIDWLRAIERCAPSRRLDESEHTRLRELATLFVRRKSLEPVQDLVLDGGDRALLAAHACIPILKLGLKWYRDWRSIVIYPDVFVPRREEMDEAGVIHHARDILAGEAWLRGPVILSWPDVLEAGRAPGHNVVIHEMAHKLDMLNGKANGYPPLPRGMDAAEWSRTFTQAWNELQRSRNNGESLPIDDYALENPGEFFAVTSEVFFEQPDTLHTSLPQVHRQLGRFYGRG